MPSRALDFSVARRQGAVSARRDPIRTCVGCRTRAPATGLLRVVAVDGILVPDPRRRLPGRGAWLHPDLDCLRTAERRRAFPRALRVQGSLDASVVRTHLEQQDEQQVQSVVEAGRPVMNQP